MGLPGLTVSSSCIWPLSFPFLFLSFTAEPRLFDLTVPLLEISKFHAFTHSRLYCCSAIRHSFYPPTHLLPNSVERRYDLPAAQSTQTTNMRCSSAVVLSTLAVGQAAAANLHNRHASFHARREA
jgi:hypothetical protein